MKRVSDAITLKAAGAHIEGGIEIDGQRRLVAVSASAKAGGSVYIPVSEVQMGAFYTFECEEGGRLYRWTNQQARLLVDEGRLVEFRLADCDPCE